MGEAAQRLMKDAGCRLAMYHPRTLRNIGVFAERDHRKLAILDGRVAWVGGHCIVDEWLGDAEDRQHVRDLSVRLTGPVVHAVQSVFSENWVEVTGKLFVGDEVFPPQQKAGDVIAHIASVKPEGSAPAGKILHHAVICCARKRIRIQNPYFIPEPDAIDALARAVRRGVDVRIMVPSAAASDMAIVQHAAHRNFQALLDGGVRILEYDRTLLHQKVMTIDGTWCAVGSSNFDDRSFETNDEITVGFLDAALARRPGGNLRGRRAPLPRARRRGVAAPRRLAPFTGQCALPVQRGAVMFYARTFALLTLGALAYLLYRILEPLFAPIAWALFIAFLIQRVQARLARKLGSRESLSAALLTL